LCACTGRARLKKLAPLTVVTVVGTVRIERRHYVCRGCRMGHVPFDQWAGIGKHRASAGACRLACLAASVWSFDAASAGLHEMCGLELSDQTIRRVCASVGQRAKAWMEESSAAAEPLRKAKGHKELSSDGTMVNTRAGWREMRLTVLSKREAGSGVNPACFTGLEDRKLPPPTARLVTARIADCDRVGEGWRRDAARAGFNRGEAPTVIGDGAKWIWNQVERTMPGAERVVDIYHVSEHLHQCGSALHGPQTSEARRWARQRLVDLVRHGPSVLMWLIEREAERWPHAAGRAALVALTNYLRPNLAGLRYADRLRRGRTIGSGQVEGACKTIIGRRLKLNSARWNPHMAENQAALCGLRYAGLWDAFWGTAVA
jgi:hypothetical protein